MSTQFMPSMSLFILFTVDSGYSHTKCFWEKCDYKRSMTICGVAKIGVKVTENPRFQRGKGLETLCDGL